MSGDYLINEFLVQVCVCTYGREVQVIGHGQGPAPASSKYLRWPRFDGHLKKGHNPARRCPMRQRQRFSKEFKLEAVRMLECGTRPASEIARELGIRRNVLYKWQEHLRAHGDEAFPGKGRLRTRSIHNSPLYQLIIGILQI